MRMGCKGWAIGVWGVLLTGAPLWAGVYHRDLLLMPEVDQNGYAIPLGFETFLATYNSAMEAGRLATDGTEFPVRKQCRERIAQLKAKPNLTPPEALELSALLIRLNNFETYSEAVELLLPRQRLGYLFATHLARAKHGLGGTTEAYHAQETATRDHDFPDSLFGMGKEQRNWYRRVEREYYFPLLRGRKQEYEHLRKEGRQRGNIADETLDAIFPFRRNVADQPVKFVDESGTYRAGEIAESEKAKLPPDAIAIVQQLLMWDPFDYRLLWLLGELYNAEGKIAEAYKCFDSCAWNGYSPTLLKEHQTVLQRVVDERERLRKEEEARNAEEEARQRRQRWMIIAAIALAVSALLYWQIREVVRRIRRRPVQQNIVQ